MTEQQKVDEQKQFYELAKYFLTAYKGTGKTFVLQHWEGEERQQMTEDRRPRTEDRFLTSDFSLLSSGFCALSSGFCPLSSAFHSAGWREPSKSRDS
jgi:hypothetical protein